MRTAIDAVQNEGMGVNKAADFHGVPRSTLKDRISGRVTHGTEPGPSPYLNGQEEKELSECLIQVSEVGYGKTRKQDKVMVETVAKEKGHLEANQKISDRWWRRFLDRQPKLAVHKGDSTAAARIQATNAETLKDYFQLLQDVLKGNNLFDKPSQIYNMDETGMPLKHRAPNVITKKGKVPCCNSGNKSQITVVGCVSASGQPIPPMVIFDAKSLNVDWAKGEVP